VLYELFSVLTAGSAARDTSGEHSAFSAAACDDRFRMGTPRRNNILPLKKIPMQNVKISRVLLYFTLLSYLLIVIRSDEFNVLMFQYLLLCFLAIPQFAAITSIITASAGIICFCLGITKALAVSKKHVRLLQCGLLLMFVPVILQQIYTPLSFKTYEHNYYIVPELAFWIMSIVVLLKTFSLNKSIARSAS
jgi:hypothetical protein